jgi:hypothetical protein
MTESAEFLEALFSIVGDGYVAVSGHRRNGDGYIEGEGGRRKWCENLNVAPVAEVADLVTDEGERWFTTQPRIEPERGGESNTSAVVCVIADFDFVGSSSGKDPDRSFTSVADVRDFCANHVPLAPSALIESGHGVHGYWFLTEPLEPESGKDLLVRFDSYVRGAAGVAGYSMDPMKDLARVLRMPGSVNEKYPDAPVPVEVVDFHAKRRYSLDDFDSCPEAGAISVNPDTSNIDSSEVDEWRANLPAGDEGLGLIVRWARTLRGAEPGHPETGRHPTALSVIGKAAIAAQDGRVDLVLAVKVLEGVFSEIKPGCAAEFSEIVDSVIKYRIAEAPLATGPDHSRRIAIPEIVGLPIVAYRASDLDALADQPMKFLVRGFLAEDTAGMWGGAQKTLKTELQIGLDLSIASGVPFLQHDEFTVDRTGPVLTFVGEGGLAPYSRRVRRVAQAYGIDVPDNYIVTGVLGEMSDRAFIASIAATIEEIDPVLVRIDPFYAYHGGDADAGNLFQQGKLLTPFAEVAAGRTFILTHHFNETGRGLGLERFTQAGSAQWVDSWVQVIHRETPDPDSGVFALGAKVGSRQWGERLYEIDVELGRLDVDTGTHSSIPAWTVRHVDYSAVETWGKGIRMARDNLGPEIVKVLLDKPWAYGRTELVNNVGGNDKRVREQLDGLIGTRQVIAAEDTYRDAMGRRRTRNVLGFAIEADPILYGIAIPTGYPEPPKKVK